MRYTYPLLWPTGWPRANNPSHHASMKNHLTQARIGVRGELERLGADNISISTNIPVRADGQPHARSTPEDTGVAVYFTLNGVDQCIPCDKWLSVAQNLRAIELTVSALRGIERWGAKEMVNAAFRGFKALPAAAIVTPYASRAWYEVLEVSQQASPETIKAAYRSLLMKHHPDQGGSITAFEEVQKAYKEATS